MTEWEGRYLRVERDGRWEYVARARSIGAAVILAIDDAADGAHVLLVEQHRVPLGRRCLELPAGLVGDDTEDEPVASAAARELEEETGWRAGTLTVVGEFASSPGLTSETYTLVRAERLERVSAGGGVAGEDITVHRVPLVGVSAFVAERRAAGVAVDGKLLMLLGVLR